LTYGSGLQELQEPCRYWLFLLLKGEAEMPSGVVIKRMFSDIYRTIKYAKHNFVNYQKESNSFLFNSSELTTTINPGKNNNNNNNINLNMPFTPVASGNSTEKRINDDQFGNLSRKFNTRAIDLVRELKWVDAEDKNLATTHKLQQLKMQIMRVLNDCPADAKDEDVKQMLRALLRVEFPGMAIETKQLNNIAANLHNFRSRLKTVGAGDEFLSAYLRMTTYVRQNTNADLFEKLSASAVYGGELFFTTVSTRPEWAEVAFKLREKSLELDGTIKGWAKEFLDDYPELEKRLRDSNRVLNSDNQQIMKVNAELKKNKIIDLVVNATKEKRKLAQYENDLIRHAKFEKQNKKSIFSKLKKKPAVDNLFGFGTNNLSLIINAKSGLFKNTSNEFNVSLYLALESRRNLTETQLKLSELNGHSESHNAGLQKIIDATTEARGNVFSSAEKQQIAEKTKLYNISEAEFIESIRSKELISFKMRTAYLKNLSFVSGKVLSSKTNISDGLVGIDKPSIWQRLRKNINLTNSQKNFPEIAMHKTNIAFLSGIDSAFESCLGPDPDDKNPAAWDEHSLAAVKRTIKALQENPEPFYKTGSNSSNMDEESKQKRLDFVWNSVVLRTALSLSMKDKNLSLDNLHKNLFCKLEELGCTADSLKKLDRTEDSDKKKEYFDRLYKELANTNQTIEDLYNVTTSVLGNVTEERATEHLRNVLMSSGKPGSFMYLNRNQLKQLNIKGTYLAKGGLNIGKYSDIFEVKITRVKEGFRVIFYFGSGWRGAVSGGGSAFEGGSGELEVGGGYRTFEGAEFLLAREKFGNNIHDLCEGVVSIIRGKNSDDTELDYESFIDRRVSHIRHFTQRQVDIAANLSGTAGGDLASFDVGVASGGIKVEGKLGVGLSHWTKFKGYETPNKKTKDNLKQFVITGSAGANASAGVAAHIPLDHHPFSETGDIPATLAAKGVQANAKNVGYKWDDMTRDKYNKLIESSNIGQALPFGSVGKMSDEECREYIRSRFAAVLDISPVDLARLKNGDFDKQIEEFAILAKENDNGLNHFIKAYGVLSFEAEAEVKALSEQALAKRENRSDKKSIKKIDKKIKSILADRKNYVITKIGLNSMHEGSGAESRKFGLAAKLLGFGGEITGQDINGQWFETQSAVFVVNLPPRGLPVTNADMKPVEKFVTPFDPNSSVLSKRVRPYSDEDNSNELTAKKKESELPRTEMNNGKLNANHIANLAEVADQNPNYNIIITSPPGSGRNDGQGWEKAPASDTAPPLFKGSSLRYGINPNQK
jgi:hypothetical protein